MMCIADHWAVGSIHCLVVTSKCLVVTIQCQLAHGVHQHKKVIQTLDRQGINSWQKLAPRGAEPDTEPTFIHSETCQYPVLSLISIVIVQIKSIHRPCL